MLRRIPRLLRRAVIVVVLLAVSAAVYQSWSAGSPGTGGWVQTQWGPLGPADRDLLVRVRLAGLWEAPTSQQAEQQASRADVREVAGKIAAEHAQLDEEVRKVANQLGVLLPSSPSSQQVAWMNEISSKTGDDYDRTYVQRLREAHGTVLPIIAQVRADTRNDLVRQFAETAAQFVTRHHQYLESTGLVDYSALPTGSPGLFSGGTSWGDLIVPVLVFAAALLAAIALFFALRQRNDAGGRRQRVTLPDPAPLPDRSPLSGLTAVAAIPAPQPGSMTVDHTGTIPTITTPAFDDSGSFRAVTDTGSHHWGGDTTRRSTTDTGSFAATSASAATATATLTDTGPQRRVTDSGSYRSVSDTGAQRAVSDTGSHRAVTDTGSHRAVADSGAHRLPRRGRHKR